MKKLRESPALAGDVESKINAAVDGWFRENIHGSAVSRNTEAYNHLHQALGALKARLVADLAGIVPDPAATEE